MPFQSNFLLLKVEYPLLLNVGQAEEYYPHADPVVVLGGIEDVEIIKKGGPIQTLGSKAYLGFLVQGY